MGEASSARDPLAVVDERVGLHHRAVVLGQRQPAQAVLGAPQDAPHPGREPVGAQLAWAVIDDADVEPHLGGQPDQRERVVARSEDYEVWGRREHVCEDRVRTVLDQGAAAALHHLRQLAPQGAVEVGVAGRDDQLAPGPERGPTQARPADGGRQGEGRRRCHELAQPGDQDLPEGAVHGLHQHVDRALAPEPEAPDRVRLGARVVVAEARGPAPDDLQRDLADVGLQAAAAHSAGRLALLRDEEPRARAPVSGPGDPDHRRQRLAGRQVSTHRDLLEDRGGLLPVLHESSVTVCAIDPIGRFDAAGRPEMRRTRT